MAYIFGTQGNDNLPGTPDADLIEGLEGNDLLNGGAGDDTLHGGSGSDILYDGPGSDLADVGLDGGAIYADVTDRYGRDTFRNDPAAGDSTLYYTDALQPIVINLISGKVSGAEIGVDRIENFPSVIGGAGADVFYGNDAATNGFFGGAGNDAAKGNGGFDRLDGWTGNDSLNGGEGNDWLFGNDGADYLVGGAGDDWINFVGPRDAGSDTVKGEAGNDVICGGSDNDVLVGGDGDDYIWGGDGADLLVGGTGADKFNLQMLSVGSQRTVIGDFVNHVDKIVGVSDASYFIAHAQDSSAGLVVNYGLNDILLIKNFTLAQLDLADFA